MVNPQFFFIVLYSLPFRILRNSEKVFDVGETLDHVQPAIRSSPVIRRDHVSECDGVDQLWHGAERQGGTDRTPS